MSIDLCKMILDGQRKKYQTILEEKLDEIRAFFNMKIENELDKMLASLCNSTKEEPQQVDDIKMEDIKPDQFLDIEMQKISKGLLIEDNKPEDKDEKTLEVQQSASGQVQKTKKSDFKKAKSIPPLMLKTNKSYEIQRRMVPLRKSVPSTPKTPTFQSTTVIQESPSSGPCNCDFLFENWRLRSKMMKATSIKTSSFSLKCKKYRRKSTSK